MLAAPTPRPVKDAIKLTLPHGKPYDVVVRLVVGGLASRLDLSLEYLEDLQLGLETLLVDDTFGAGEDVTLELALERGVLEVTIGPLDGKSLETALAPQPAESRQLGLRRLLEAVVEEVELERRNGHGWVRLRKQIPGDGPAPPG